MIATALKHEFFAWAFKRCGPLLPTPPAPLQGFDCFAHEKWYNQKKLAGVLYSQTQHAQWVHGIGLFFKKGKWTWSIQFKDNQRVQFTDLKPWLEENNLWLTVHENLLPPQFPQALQAIEQALLEAKKIWLDRKALKRERAPRFFADLYAQTYRPIWMTKRYHTDKPYLAMRFNGRPYLKNPKKKHTLAFSRSDSKGAPKHQDPSNQSSKSPSMDCPTFGM
jgi:hypothetical protein